MPEQVCHLANKYEDIVKLQGGGGIFVSPRAQLVVGYFSYVHLFVFPAWADVSAASLSLQPTLRTDNLILQSCICFCGLNKVELR